MLPVTLYFPAGIQTTPPPASSAAWMALWIAFVESFTPVLSALKGDAVTSQLATTISLVGKTVLNTRGDTSVCGMFFSFNEMSSNQISPVGVPSVIRRRFRLVFEPLFQFPLRYCQLPDMLVQS